jgi:iron complex outermembrane receptor protein
MKGLSMGFNWYFSRARSSALSLIILTLSQGPVFAQTAAFDIPAEDASKSIPEFARQAGLQIIAPAELVKGVTTRAIHGSLDVHEALRQLLSGTDLTIVSDDGKTIGLAGRQHQRESSDGVHPNLDSEPALTEIIVTAQKKTERLQDVPMSITVVDPQALAEKGQNSLLDYFDSVPGLNVSSNAGGNAGMNYITIRGLSAGYNQNPIVSTVIDDVPVASSTQRGQGGLTSPDLDPSDLARIEVLKGPQGTLYGADSLGGLIKYVTADPSAKSFGGRVQVTGVDIPGGGVGYAVRGAVNIPISEDFAVRVSGFDRRDPGYIDDLTTGHNNFNTTDVYGGHLAALWRPSDNFSVKVSALVQQIQGETSAFDSNTSGESTYSDLSLHSLPGTTGYTTQDQLYSATVDWKVAALDIVSVTGYVVNSVRPAADITNPSTGFGYLAYYCQQYPNPFLSTGLPNPYYCGNSLPPGANPNAYTGAVQLAHYGTHKPTEELRISSSIGRWLDWRLGAFYTHEEGVPNESGYFAANPITGAVGGPLYFDTDPTETFQEYAVFGDFTAHMTDRFDIDVGGRESWNKQAEQYLDVGTAVYEFDGVLPPELGAYHKYSANAFTYQVAPRFKITPDLMVYARVASGYRVGGYNVLSGLPKDGQIPAGYAPDKTTNFEVGIKSDLLDRRLTLDAAVYYIDWRNFQSAVVRSVPLAGGNGSIPAYFIINAGNAKSEGVEFSIEARPLEGLTITAQGSYDDAVLTGDLPAGTTNYGVKGTQLPYSMRFSGGLAVSQDIRLTNNWIGSLGGTYNYVGSRPYEFVGAPAPGQAPSPRTFFPAYRPLNLLAGARYDSLRVNLYVNNVTNARGILSFNGASSIGNIYENNSSVIQPRTIGLSITKVF